MRKGFISLLILLVALTIISWRPEIKQDRTLQVYGVAFYNLENLFDTIHDEGKNDYENLPDGTNKWGALKYTSKLKNMAQVLANLGTEMTMKNGFITGYAFFSESGTPQQNGNRGQEKFTTAQYYKFFSAFIGNFFRKAKIYRKTLDYGCIIRL